MTENLQKVEYSVDGTVATIKLTRPDTLNALDDQVVSELAGIVESLRRPGDIRAVIFCSIGKAFSAGGDFDEIRRLAEDYQARMESWEEGRRVVRGFSDIGVPVIVALQGDVYGLATSLALSGDIIVASKNVRIGDPHVKIGLVAGDGGTAVWPAAFGLLKAKRHLLTGDPIMAEEAHRLGAISELVEHPDDVLPMARSLADKVSALSPIAVQYTKRALNHVQQRQLLDQFEFSMALEQYAMSSEDLLEALAAVKENRKPDFKNK